MRTRTPIRTHRLAGIVAALVVVVSVARTTDAATPVRCAVDPPTSGCCAAADFACDETTVSPVSAARKNILLVIADDLGYCHYGFMGSGPPGHFRLSELSCRNRRSGSDPSHTPSPNAEFPFNRSGADSTWIDVKTPVLDDLAEHGALFPRAHVAGVSCVPSRRTLMIGRHQRHAGFLGGNALHQCAIEVRSCASDSDCAMPGDHCIDVRTLPRILREFSAGDYRSMASGKAEWITDPGFDEFLDHSAKPQVGKFRCTDTCLPGDCCAACSSCEADLLAGAIPPEADASVHVIPDFIERNVIDRQDTPGGTVSRQTHPFFVWYGPHIPHADTNPESFFLGLYPDESVAERRHFARISWLDTGIGALRNYLAGACVCARDPNGVPARQSLYDSTVVIVLADQGYLLPSSKGQATENNFRTPLLVSEPRHRSGEVAPHVFTTEIAHVIDVMQTMLAYAGVPTAERPPYAFARDLKPFIENPGLGPIREIEFGEKGKSSIITTVGLHHALNRPGLLGVCEQPVDVDTFRYADRRPCVSDADCAFQRHVEGRCLKPGEAGSNRCVNRPDLACATDAECAVASLCAAGKCKHDASLGSFADFDGRDCSTSAECVPPGVCQPVILKAEGSSTGVVRRLWEVNNDPDQSRNLLFVDPDYLGPCVRSEFEHCLFRFREGGAPFVPYVPPPHCHPESLCGPLAWCGPAVHTCP
jgi:arylsulfatase A-like enzyme